MNDQPLVYQSQPKKLIFASIRAYPTRWTIPWVLACFFAGVWLVLNIPIRFIGLTFPAKIGLTLLTGLGIGILLFAITAWWSGWEISHDLIRRDRLAWVYYATPMVISWTIYLLAFWPGMMSADSMDQWGQMVSGVYNDWHPAFHTFTIWLLTRIVLSPAIVAFAQLLALSLVAGAVLAFARRQGVSRAILGIACAIFALSPINGTMVNTLWKDIPYSTAVLGLTLLIAEVVVSKGLWLDSWWHRILLGITAALVTLFRHDGLTVGFGSLVMLWVVFPRRWKGLLVVSIISMGLFLGIRGPVYRAVGVQDRPTVGNVSVSLYSLAAYARPGSPADEIFDDMNLSLGSWGCSIWSRLSDSQVSSLDKGVGLDQLLSNIIRRVPNALLFSYRCTRSMVWIIWDPSKPVYNASHVNVLVDPNSFGILPDSQIPGLQKVVSDFVTQTSTQSNLNWLFWRPAIFLYIFLFSIGIFVLRRRDVRGLAVVVPILIQSIGFSLLWVNPNFRYYYAAYLLAIIFWPLVFVPKEKSAEPASNSIIID